MPVRIPGSVFASANTGGSGGLPSGNGNLFVATPDGTPGVASLRAIVPTDLAGTPAAGSYWDGTGVWTPLPTGGGTVTSVDVAVPTYMSSTGGPVTTTGIITLAFGSQAQRLFFASPNSGSGLPVFRAIAVSDMPSGYLYSNLSGAPSSLPPSGSAGGDLTGTYPNPTLAAIGSAAGPIGDGTHVASVSIDAKGRVIGLSSVAITGAPPSGAAGGDLAGTYPNPTVPHLSSSVVGLRKGAGTGNLDTAAVAADLPSLLTTKGDIQGFSTVPVRVPIGSVNGLIPVQDSTQAAGWSWQSGQTGAGSNITPDTHPVVQNAQNDEFEQGTVIDTSGSRFSGATAWTAFNIGSTTTSVIQGQLVLIPSNIVGSNQTGYTQPVSGATWAYTTKVWLGVSANGAIFGLTAINGSNGRLITIGLANTSNTVTLIVQKLTNSTTFSSNAVATTIPPGAIVTAAGMLTTFAYLQIVYDGTTIFYKVSMSGTPGTFGTAFSEVPGTFLLGAPTLIGITCQSNSPSAGAIIGSYDWFRKTA